MNPASATVGGSVERRLGRALILVTYVAVVLLLVGVVLLLASGASPMSGGPALDAAALVASILALEPAGFLWLGLLAVIATPVTRVIGAVVAFSRGGERLMAAVSFAILGVISVGIAAALLAG